MTILSQLVQVNTVLLHFSRCNINDVIVTTKKRYVY